MIHHGFKAAMAASLLAIIVIPNAKADSGLAFLHDKVIIGGLTCMKDHTHTGSSSDVSQQAAKASAIASWASFTALEYGDEWGSYKLAAHKRASCNYDMGQWHCKTEATPCRR